MAPTKFCGVYVNEKNRTTARLRRDAEQHARSVRETLEVEYGDRMAAALEESEESAALSSTAQKNAARLGEKKVSLVCLSSCR